MEDGDIPPFWQPPVTLTRRNRHRSSSPILNSSLLIILLPSIALLFTVFIIIPSIHKILPITNNTNNTQNQKSISVKKSWHLLNITLVLFAILCGIFAKRNDDSSSVTTIERDEQVQQHPTQTRSTSTTAGSLRRSKTMMHNYNQSSSSVPQWFEYSQQQRITTSPTNTPQPDTGISRLRRTVSSDPYMKYTNNNDNHNTKKSQFRFFDDIDISRFYPKDEEYKPQLAEATMSPAEFEKTPVKDIEVDNFELQNRGESQSPTFSPPQTPPRNPPAPSPPPPPPPPPAKQRRTFQTIPRGELVPPSPPPPPPPPPPPQMPRGREEKRRSSRKRMNATKEIATAIVHLYSQRKRKRRQKSQKLTRNFDDSSENRSQFFPPPSPPPPPPPLPPHPSSAFKSWFKKGSKTKKIHSFSSIPKPPPPPIRQKPAKSAGKPPLPARRESGRDSPVNGLPPPPPPPPYKVRPEIDGRDEVISSAREMDGGDGERVSSVTCPSPDLNVKADSFIARHHDGWRLEKLNSWREKLNKAGNGPTL